MDSFKVLDADGNFKSDEQTKDLIACVASNDGSFDEDGNFIPSVIKMHLEQMAEINKSKPVDYDAVLEKCLILYDTRKETVYRMSKCFFEEKAIDDYNSEIVR